MQARVLPLLSSLGLATLLLAAAVPQDTTTLREHQLESCEVIITPVGQRKLPLSVMFEESPTTYGASFDVSIAKTGLVSVSDLTVANPAKPLPAGTGKLLFTYDPTNKAFDVTLTLPGTPNPIAWDNTLARGVFDPLGKLEEPYAVNVRHPTDTTGTKKAVRIIFNNFGLQGGFLLIDQ